ncbi:MAG: substrate-binding domain-containing protein, partial [Cyanobacteria bacterium J06558_2]
MNQPKISKTIASIGIAFTSLVLAFAPIPGVRTSLVVVGGTELQEPLKELEAQFEEKYPQVDLELEFQGSQDIANNFLQQKNQPHILIAANAEILQELSNQYLTKYSREAFSEEPTAIVKTLLVAIAWQERGKILFPGDRFDWEKIEQAMQQGSWSKIAAKADWGSFDFVMTNPNRSNSGQLALDLWLKSQNLALTSPEAASLVSLIKKSVYQPSRSTDILLQEFISRGANEGDIAIIYESIALNRWSQAQISQGEPYRIYYPQPTIETVITAAIVQQNISPNLAKAAQKFIDYLTQLEQQQVFVEYGFRPVISGLDLQAVESSPWAENIPGAALDQSFSTIKPPNAEEIIQIQRL